jgi:glyoxylase-like metal-dependent hydrolase (beta-lactamase superfamily II)
MRFFLAAMRSARSLTETAVHQVQQVGYAPNDVRHIIMTHLHIDHAGGLADFPHAAVHLYQPEHDHVMSGRAGWEYVRDHWAHQPRWQPHQVQGAQWYGFPAIRLENFAPEMWLIPLVGHSPGHIGVAIRTEQGWLLHAGDAVPYNMAVDDVPDWLARRLIGPHVPRIRSLIQDHRDIQVIGSHMAPAFYAHVSGW